MSIALNSFKTITANVTTTLTSVYTPPSGYATVVLLAQISNISGSTITVSGYHLRSGTTTALIQGASVPTNDAINLLTGRLILQYGDSLEVSASSNNTGQLLLSVLETSTS